MRKALFFKDIQSVHDFVWKGGEDSFSKQGFLFYTLRDPSLLQNRLFCLVGFRVTRKVSLLSFFSNQKEYYVEENSPFLIRTLADQKTRERFEILQIHQCNHLLELVSLRPAKVPNDPISLVFKTKDSSALSEIMTQIPALSIQNVFYARTGKTVCLRLPMLSHFLISLCEENFPTQVEIFLHPNPLLYVQWGKELPFQKEWLSRIEKKSLWFHSHLPQEKETTPLLEWLPLSTSPIAMETLSLSEEWKLSSQKIPKWKLNLNLADSPKPSDPRYWLVPEDEKQDLIHLFSLTDEEDLDDMEVSFVSFQEENWFLLREKESLQPQKYLEWGGEAFSPYQGISNVLLHVDVELHPFLRRDQIKKQFGISNEKSSLLRKNPNHPSSFQEIQFSEKDFQPLQNGIHYSLSSPVDFLDASAHWDPFSIQTLLQDFQPEVTAKKEKEGLEIEEALWLRQKKNPREAFSPLLLEDEPNLPEKKIKQEDAPPSAQFSENKKAQLQIINQIIQEGQSFELWSDLFQLKRRNNQYTKETVDCLWEALCFPFHDTDEWIRDSWKFLSQESLIHGTPTDMLQQLTQKLKDGFSETYFTTLLLMGRTVELSHANQWIGACYNCLRTFEPILRKKMLWLAWKEVFRVNQDLREQARVKEVLLRQLDENGLEYNDIPSFMQGHIMETRFFIEEKDKNQSDELFYARKNLEVLEQAFRQIQDISLRNVALTRLAWSFYMVQNADKSNQIRLETLGQIEEVVDQAKAWIYLFGLKLADFFIEEPTSSWAKEQEKVLKKLSKQEAECLSTLQEIEQAIQSRMESENTIEFFAQKSLRRLETNHFKQTNDLYGLHMQRIQIAEKERKYDLVMDILSKSMDEAIKEILNQTMNYSRLFHVFPFWMERLLKLRGQPKYQETIDKLEDLVLALPNVSQEKLEMDCVFQISLQFRIARGLLQINVERLALDLLKTSLATLQQDLLVHIDFIDVCALAIPALEVVPFVHRRELLISLLDSLVQQLNGSFSSIYIQTLLPWLFQYLDMLIEAAVSKDQLAFEIFQHYCVQDEMILRNCILVDSSS